MAEIYTPPLFIFFYLLYLAPLFKFSSVPPAVKQTKYSEPQIVSLYRINLTQESRQVFNAPSIF